MHAYQVHPGKNFDGIVAIQRTLPAPGPYEVRVRIRAVALNYRDLMVIRGDYNGGDATPVIPASDGAGEVVEIGAKVTRFRVGDRVATTFFANWIEGRQTPQKSKDSFGGLIDGALAEEIVVSQDALFKVPAHLDYAEAATLTCAGVTAWNSLFVEGHARPGDSVLLLGTGGVSIWGLQLAKAAGLRTLITSSSDAKLERARALGADVTINYTTTPDWHEAVRSATGGDGVDVVIEVGGAGTLKKSLQSTRMGGTVAIVGGVSGWGSELDPFLMIRGAAHLSGIYVGSLAMLEDLARFVALHRIKPVVDRVFPFAQARQAYEYLDGGSHFGKVVIALD
ncbi:MAG TPA: NAD(P)-dependent alcohol dehydrogenase [Tahibacter sp.]|nr:NAD(P)-dependent alcohol dehydrogenase [Tahibacter sp.]